MSNEKETLKLRLVVDYEFDKDFHQLDTEKAKFQLKEQIRRTAFNHLANTRDIKNISVDYIDDKSNEKLFEMLFDGILNNKNQQHKEVLKNKIGGNK